jgi:DEAD/DEAH box helicase domain-containing protein
MSGTFENIDVPPTLVSFAVNTVNVDNIISNEFKLAGSRVVMLKLRLDDNVLPDFDELDKVYSRINKLAKEKVILSASSVRSGGIAEIISKMTFGNLIGFNFEGITDVSLLFKPFYGSIVLELPESLDLTNRIATVFPVDMNYFTVPFVETDVNVLREFKKQQIMRTEARFGDVKVKEAIPAYKMVQFHNHQNLGFERITLPLYQEIETEGLWFTVPDEVDEAYNSYTMFNYYNGLKHSLLNAAMMRTMATREDMGSTIFNTKEGDDEVKKSHILLYDLYPGGLGFSEKAYDFGCEIIEDAILMVDKCSCENGCPACVGDYHLDKKLVQWGLKALLKNEEPPSDIKIAEVPSRIVEEYLYSLEELPGKWGEFVSLLKEKSEYLNSFLSTISNVEISGNVLMFVTDFRFYEDWILQNSNKKKIMNTIRRYVKVPQVFDIGVRVIDKEPQDIQEKIMRRYDDLVK